MGEGFSKRQARKGAGMCKNAWEYTCQVKVSGHRQLGAALWVGRSQTGNGEEGTIHRKGGTRGRVGNLGEGTHV